MKRFRTLLPCIIGISLFLMTSWTYAATFIVDNLGDVEGPHALSLDGYGDYMEVADDDSLDITEAITLETWVKPGDQSAGNFNRIITKPHTSCTDPFDMYCMLIHTSGRIRFQISISGTHRYLDAQRVLPINEWSHVVESYDGNQMKIYINGALDNSQYQTGNIDTNNQPLYLGIAVGACDGEIYNGFIDEVRVWNIARTQVEIQTTMNTTLQGDEEGLIGYWNFDDGTANDSSPYDNHGKLEDAEIIPLVGTWPPKKTGDVSGDRTISAYDAALILRYVVGLMDEFPADSMVSPSAISPRSYIVEIPELSARVGDRIHVPIVINNATGLWAGGISLKYDGAILKAINVLTDITLNGSYWKANTELDGEVRFAFATTEPAKGQGNLLIVEFEILPNTEGKTSRLMVDNVNLSNSLNITKINGSVTVIPSTFALLQNYPNPFNPDTWIPFELATDASVTINIYNAKGQLIRTIVLGQKAAGVYLSKDKAAYWDGRDNSGEKVSSGVYFYTLQTGKFTATRKLVVVK